MYTPIFIHQFYKGKELQLSLMCTLPYFLFHQFYKGKELQLSLMGTLPIFFNSFTKGNNFCDFQFAPMDNETLPKKDLFLQERICSKWSKFFCVRVDPFETGGMKGEMVVASPQFVPIHFQPSFNPIALRTANGVLAILSAIGLYKDNYEGFLCILHKNIGCGTSFKLTQSGCFIKGKRMCFNGEVGNMNRLM